VKFWQIALLLAAMAALALLLQAKAKKTSRGLSESPKARPPLTEREQVMFFRLSEALPEYIVLAQVAMSALMTASTQAARNRFDRKVIDFVVCSKAFEVIAVVELDDSSHRGKEAADDRRDKLLKAAGFRTVRFRDIPASERLRTAVLLTEQPAKVIET
jgi:very-short-patch-repair endonuclease